PGDPRRHGRRAPPGARPLVGAPGARRRAARPPGGHRRGGLGRHPHGLDHPGAGAGHRAAPGGPGVGRPPPRGPPARRLAREPVPGAGPMTGGDAPAPPAPGAAPTRPPGPSLAPVWAMLVYTLRTSLPGRRRWGLILPCLGAVGFGAINRVIPGSAADNFADMAAVGLFGLVLPITALVVGDAVLGAEVRRGSFTFT